MPIRFSCPHCQQKLSVGARKAGTKADCPRCKQTLVVPEPPPPAAHAANIEPLTEGTGAKPGRDESNLATDVAFVPNASELESVELVYDTSDRQLAAPPVAADVVTVPRYVLYVQGGLLAGVALVAFALGLAAGGAGVRPAAAPQPCVISGSVTFASGPRVRPDEGAVVILLPPLEQRPEQKVPASGLRPGDPPPRDERSLRTLRGLGGDSVRTDGSGQFELTAPRRGRYLLLVISGEKPSREPLTSTTDVRTLGRVFADPAALLAGRRYRLLSETIGGNRQINVAFD